MSDTSSPRKKAIVPISNRRLISNTSGLARRGLKLSDTLQDKTLATQKPIRHFEGIYDRSCVAFSQNGRYALVCPYGMDNLRAYDFDMVLWDTKSGVEKHLNLGPRPNQRSGDLIYDIAITPNGRYILCASFYCGVRLWDIYTQSEVEWRRRGPGEIKPAYFVEFFPGGQFFVTAGRNGVCVWELHTGQEICRFPLSVSWYNEVAISSDGNNILVGGWSKDMRLLDVWGKRELHCFTGHQTGYQWINGVALSSDGSYALSGCDDLSLHLWDIKTGRLIRKWFHTKDPGKEILDGGYSAVAFSPDSHYALSGCSSSNQDTPGYGGMMYLWEVASGCKVYQYKHRSGVVKVAFLPDGRHVLSGCWDGSVYLWKLPDV